MDDKPMLHEPGVRETHADFLPYHRIIEYKTIEFACCRLLNRAEFDRYIILPDACRPYFYALMCELFGKNRDQILERARALKDKYATTTIPTTGSLLSVAIYGMHSVLNYDALVETAMNTRV
jgi:hypothetical protein